MKSIALCENSLVAQSENVKDVIELSITEENGNMKIRKLKIGNINCNTETHSLTGDKKSVQNLRKNSLKRNDSNELNLNGSLTVPKSGDKVHSANSDIFEDDSDSTKLANKLNNKPVRVVNIGKILGGESSSVEPREKLNYSEEVESESLKEEFHEKNYIDSESNNFVQSTNKETAKESNTIDNVNNKGEVKETEGVGGESGSGQCLALEEDENKENRKGSEDMFEEVDLLTNESEKLEIQVGNCQSIADTDKSSWNEESVSFLTENEKSELEEVKEEKEGGEKKKEEDKYEEPAYEEEIMEIDVEKELEQLKNEKKEKCNDKLQSNLDEGSSNKAVDEVRVDENKIKSPVQRKRLKSSDEDNFVVAKKSKVDFTNEINKVKNSSRRSSSSLDADGGFNKDIDIMEPEVILREDFEENDNYDFNISKQQNSEGIKAKAQPEEKTPLTSSFLANLRGTLKNLTRSDLEELVVQKLCEVITERSNVGELRRKAQILEQDQEKWKTKVQSLTKFVKEMEMVLKKYMSEVQKQTKDGDPHSVVPFKVTRSVGLQVSFYSNGNKPLKAGVQQQQQQQQQQQKQQKQQSPSAPSTSSTQNGAGKPVKAQVAKASQQSSASSKNTWVKASTPKSSSQPSPQKFSPQLKKHKPLLPKPDSSTSQQIRPVLPQPFTPTTRSQTTSAQGSRHSMKSSPAAQGYSPQQSPLQQPQNNNSKVIDLTDDDDKQPESIGKPSNSIRVINHLQQQPQVSQNNRFAYILPTTSAPAPGVSPAQSRQVLIATPTVSQPQRPMMCSMPPLLYKGGNVVQPPPPQPQIINQPNRLYVPKQRHPAPLPAPPLYKNCTANQKLLPPRPALKISRVPTGIVLSWNMSLGPEHAPISSYQLYAYQENNSVPSTSMWKKVGDVKALPLPMACTLTQFMSGHKYHFAVRAVDFHSRIGPFSFPGTIVLVK